MGHIDLFPSGGAGSSPLKRPLPAQGQQSQDSAAAAQVSDYLWDSIPFCRALVALEKQTLTIHIGRLWAGKHCLHYM
jgi:hypothetical protein